MSPYDHHDHHDHLASRTLARTDAQAWQRLAEEAQTAWLKGAIEHAGELFLELQERSSSWLLAIAYADALMGTADEMVAQTYFQFYELLVAGTPVRNAKALLGTILRRRIIDLRRRQGDVTIEQVNDDTWTGLRNRPDALADTPEEVVVARESVRYVANVILDTLPDEDRQVLIARHLCDLSVTETAQRLHLTDDQVKKRTRRAIELARRVAEERGLL